MKSILLINYEYPPIGAGAANATYHIARSLATDHGLRVTVLTAGFGKQKDWASENGISVYRCNSLRRRADRSGMLEKLSFLFSARRALPAIIRKTKPDGAIVFFSLPCGPLGLFLKKRFTIPYVVSLRGGDVPGIVEKIDLWHTLLRPLRRAVLSNASAIIANSAGLKNASEAADPFPVRVIPNGVDCRFFRPRQTTDTIDRAYRLLFVGRFHDQKNLHVLLHQFASIKDSLKNIPVTLELVGDGPLRNDLLHLASRLDLMKNITWRGWLDKNELLKTYQQCDCFINPSLYEGSPNAVLEAMACGLPVIASNIMGNDELVIDNDTGLLFDLSHPSALQEKIDYLLRNRSTGVAMGREARRRAESCFSWEKVAAAYQELFASARQD
jgi:glycosyltransferase involved in cell wall biosynthesis